MRLESSDGVSALELTIAGYEFPDNLSDRDTANWLEFDLRVRTPHGQGTSRVGLMRTWDTADFADWLDALSARHSRWPGEEYMVFPEPNLQFHATGLWRREIILHVYFILELPGEWEMDDAPDEGSNYYSSTMNLRPQRAALQVAATSLRAELRRFPVREAST
jgi:hypothetical protein